MVENYEIPELIAVSCYYNYIITAPGKQKGCVYCNVDEKNGSVGLFLFGNGQCTMIFIMIH